MYVITKDSGVDVEKIAKSLLKKFDNNVEKLIASLNEKFSIISEKTASQLSHLDRIARNPFLQKNLLNEINYLTS